MCELARTYILKCYMQEPFVNIPEDLILCALQVLLGRSTSDLHWLRISYALNIFLIEYYLQMKETVHF